MGHLVIIDENSQSREQVQAWASAAGYDVHAIDKGRAGLALIKDVKPQVVIASGTTEDISGFEIASRLAYDYSVATVLLVDTDQSYSGDVLMAQGIAEFVQRPLHQQEVLARLERAQEMNKMLRARERLVSELERLSQTDGLTGLLNARVFFKRLKMAAQLARESQTALSLIMIDLDFFKRLNDKLGHSSGNDALQAVGSTLLQNVKRGYDAFRYGGEEFTVLLPGLDMNAAAKLAEELRHSIETMGMKSFPEAPITASIGVAEYKAGEAPERLANRSDEAMYQAKRQGRNRVIVSGDDVAP